MNIGNIGPGLLLSLHRQPMKWHVVLGELCDNSFDAGASRVEIVFGPGKTLRVIDDGHGCGSIERMLTLGDHYHQSTTKLGRYGVGLKESACWLWGELEVRTVHKGKQHKAHVDWGSLSRQENWNVPDPVVVDTDDPQGTQLIFRGISKGFPDYEQLQSELSYTFAPALWSGKQIVMKFARRQPITCAGWQMPPVEEQVQDSFIVNGKGVTIKAGIVSLGAPNPRKGFSICHGHRMIGDSTAFGSKGHSVSRISGIVELDSAWSLSKNKTDVVDEFQEELEDAIFSRCESIILKSAHQAEILRNSALENKVSESLQSMLGEMKKASRSSGDSSGSVSPKGSKKRHRRAKKTQPGDSFMDKCRVGKIRMEWAPRDDGLAGYVDLKGDVIYLNENHSRMRYHRERENTDALVDHCLYLLCDSAVENEQMDKLPACRDHHGFVEVVSHVLHCQHVNQEAEASSTG